MNKCTHDLDGKPFAPACERNRDVIYDVLKQVISKDHKSVLEIGAGTGQHGVYFAEKFPNLNWTCSDLLSSHPGIKLWLEEAKLENLNGPIEFEVGKNDFPEGDYDIVFTANTFQIMSWEHNKLLIEMCGKKLKPNSLFITYGPFNYDGNYTSDSNAQFDIWLKGIGAHCAIRSFEEVFEQMAKAGFSLLKDFEMPANNRMLVFKHSFSC